MTNVARRSDYSNWEAGVAKDKKKAKKDKAPPSAKRRATPSKTAKITRRLKAVADNPLAAEIVAAALVATAAALKDSAKARQLADYAGEELAELGDAAADRGTAMWQFALEIGRQTLDTLAKGKGKGKGKSE